MTVNKPGRSAARKRRGPAALVRERERLQELRDELVELQRLAESTKVPDVRSPLLFAVEKCSWSLDMIDACRGGNTTLPPSALGLAERAIGTAFAVESARVLGVSPLSVLWNVAHELGSACAHAANARARREGASDKFSAARQLRTLAAKHPEKTAAELRRLVEESSGGRVDESAARTVVRNARAVRGG